MQPGRRREDIAVVAGDVNGTVRVGVSDFVLVRMTPSGEVMAAVLRKKVTSTNVDTAVSQDLLNDANLPASGDPLIAYWGQGAFGPNTLYIDVSSLTA